ncbi:riboflavin synthase [Ligilactobacillus acidipiscis]|uniref:riboflavin synthase n=1 Tax=Ligilactobacillus acidipiscis TaxID=89059 RepID=UPI0023F90EF8|nr:riboflavin synthase [Ligilactobacillus acidipiscis]WEV58194.1 riboflavin synthase [Ligilactobacillus acidipiscis]
MFTGIIKNVGTVKKYIQKKQHAQIKIKSRLAQADFPFGASIAVNGTCLTVTAWENDSFVVDAMPETIQRTNLHLLEPGKQVNLEPALQIGERFDGHLVLGHVDTTAKLVAKDQIENSVALTFQIAPEFVPYIVEKGSVAIDGISLTVARVTGQIFTVDLIPYTLSHTNLNAYELDSQVNLETDILGKYIVSLINKQVHSSVTK